MLDIAIARGATPDEDGGYNGAELARHGVMPVIGGCQGCEATIAVYNAYPGLNGYWVGGCCLDQYDTYPDVAAFAADHPWPVP